MATLEWIFGDQYKSADSLAQVAAAKAGFAKDYPGLQELINQGQRSQAGDELVTAQQITPGYNDLAMGELARNAPRMLELQDILDSGQAATDVSRLNRFGPQAGVAMRATDASANPEYYAGLEQFGGKFGDALGAISPTLTAGRRAEVERGVARMNPGGSDNSAAETANKASQFGLAHDENVNSFVKKINSLSSALPQLKSGLNPVNLALGRDSRKSPVYDALTPVTSPGTAGLDIGANIFGNMMAAERQKQSIDANMYVTLGESLNQDADSFNKVASGMSGMGGGGGGAKKKTPVEDQPVESRP